MALSQSVASELLEAFRAGEGVDLIRESVRLVMQELIETEASRADRRRPLRAHRVPGHRPQRVPAAAGRRPRPAMCELRIPKLRKGSFFPAILEPRRRIDQALYAVVMEAYVNGVSTRAVDDLVAALGVGVRHLQVRGEPDLRRAGRAGRGVPRAGRCTTPAFRTCSSTPPTSTSARGRAGHLDGGRGGDRGDRDGGREVLGVDVGDCEDEVFWRGFLRTLRERGLAGVQLVISDQHAGLVAALGRVFQGVGHQRCRVHFARNLLALVPKSHKDMVAAVFRTIFAQPDAEAVAATWDSVRDQLAAALPQDRAADGRRESRGAGVHRLPPQPLGQDLVDQPARAGQQGDQTPSPRRRHLPQRGPP